jgi:flagellar biosynthesis/type III secretory pathway protein FliH
MPWSDAEAFVPLAGPAADDPFRPFGTPVPDAPAAAPPPAPEPDPREAAFAAGRVRGRAEAAAEHAALARDVAAALDAIGAWREELRTRYTQSLVALALETARRIVGDELDQRPERWVPIVAGAIRRLVDRDQVTVRVPPRLAACLRAHTTALAPDATDVRIVEDSTLAADACRVESRTGDVECGVAAALATVADALGVGEG